MNRTNNTHDPITQTRQDMEMGVIAYNCFLKDSINQMSNIALLRNMHPLDRSTFAKRLYVKGVLQKHELIEFSDID